ncbi:MAG: PP2C family serine/threonine-protein phosphatase [Pseudomonadota bacterium]
MDADTNRCNSTPADSEEKDAQSAATASTVEWKDLQPTDESDPVEHTKHDTAASGDWFLLGASRRGRSHAHAGTYREDAFAMVGDPDPNDPKWWAIAAADGAGSCRLSRVGANLAVKEVTAFLSARDDQELEPRERLETAVSTALRAVQDEARKRDVDVKDLSSTLLVLLWVRNEEGIGGRAFTFQAGDGLMTAVDDTGTFDPLALPDSEVFAGTTHFFTGMHVKDTWDRRFGERPFEKAPAGFLVMTDGVADDLVPYERNGPIIFKELLNINGIEEPGPALVELLGYEKRGSFDDRTLVCALRSERVTSADSSTVEPAVPCAGSPEVPGESGE